MTPEQIPDYKALVGDPSDNIPGVRGIGPKGAANLLQKFGTVAEIYENLDEVSAKGTRKKLEDGRESAFVSLELARMRFDAPVQFDAEALQVRGGLAREPRRVAAALRVPEPRAPLRRAAGGRRRRAAARRAARVSVSEEPVELVASSRSASRRSGTGAGASAVSEGEVGISDGLPDRPLRGTRRQEIRGARAPASTRSWRLTW